MKLIFNEEKLKKILKKEIELLKKKFKASDKMLEIRRMRFRIARLKKMERRNDILKYFECFKAKYDIKEEEKTKASTDDDKINKILKIEKTELKKYEEKFYSLEYKIKKTKSQIKNKSK